MIIYFLSFFIASHPSLTSGPKGVYQEAVDFLRTYAASLGMTQSKVVSFVPGTAHDERGLTSPLERGIDRDVESIVTNMMIGYPVI